MNIRHSHFEKKASHIEIFHLID